VKVAELLQEGRRSSDERTFRGRDLAQLRKDYQRWRRLVNMPSKTLRALLFTKGGEEAGLSRKEVKRLRTRRGRDSARAVLRMRAKPFSEWTSDDFGWMYRQINFVTRARGGKGPLLKDGGPTRRLSSLLAWGHKPPGISIGIRDGNFYVRP